MDNEIDDLFVGDFAEAGEFSLREYIEHPDDRVVVIDSPQDETDTVGAMFALLLDMIIRYGLASTTQTNYVLDEIDELPALSRLSSLASAGRKEGIRALIGVQTKGQLDATYGSKASDIYGNCPQGLYFSPGDSETTEYILVELVVVTLVAEVDRTPITSGELKQFDRGECVVANRTD